jgi:hypothetical protein
MYGVFPFLVIFNQELKQKNYELLIQIAMSINDNKYASIF